MAMIDDDSCEGCNVMLNEADNIKQWDQKMMENKVSLDKYNVHDEKYSVSIGKTNASFERNFVVQCIPKQAMYPCAQCDYVGKYPCRLRQHMKIHSGETPFTCKICQKSYKTKGAVKSHMFVHSNMRPFSCAMCKQRFKRKKYLKTHEMNIHGKFPTGRKKFKCIHCEFTTNALYYLNRHINVHSRKISFECNVCEIIFKRKYDLDKHKRMRHTQIASNLSPSFNFEWVPKHHEKIDHKLVLLK